MHQETEKNIISSEYAIAKKTGCVDGVFYYTMTYPNRPNLSTDDILYTSEECSELAKELNIKLIWIN